MTVVEQRKRREVTAVVHQNRHQIENLPCFGRIAQLVVRQDPEGDCRFKTEPVRRAADRRADSGFPAPFGVVPVAELIVANQQKKRWPVRRKEQFPADAERERGEEEEFGTGSLPRFFR